jgi:RNase P subunit Pop3
LIKKQVMTSLTYYAGTFRILVKLKYSLLAPLASHRTHQPPNPLRKRKRRKPNTPMEHHPLFVNPPPLISDMTIGFNPTTEHLESEIQNAANKQMRAVFVARGDTSSTHLYAHFPLMASMLPHVRLVSMAKGAEQRLCEALQLKRVGVIGLLVLSLFLFLLITVGRCARSGDTISTC